MVVSTIYDPDLRAKVFQIRDTERYTNSTQTSLEVTYQNNNKNYLAVTLTATIKRAIGDSNIAFYCDGEFIGAEPYSQGDTDITLSAHVPYGYHKFYAKFLGNAECLSSKSGIVELEITEPNLARTLLDFGYANLNPEELTEDTWFATCYNARLRVALEDLTNGDVLAKDITIYVNGVESGTYTTRNSITPITTVFSDESWQSYSGLLNIRMVFEGDDEYSSSEVEKTLLIGYNLMVTQDANVISVNDTIDVGISLLKLTGERATVQPQFTLKEGNTVIATESLDSNAEATFSLNPTLEGTHTYELYSDTLQNAVGAFDVDAVMLSEFSMTVSDEYICEGNTSSIMVYAMTQEGNIQDLLVRVNGKKYFTNSVGTIHIPYAATGVGLVSYSAVSGRYTATQSFYDLVMYFNMADNIDMNFEYQQGGNITLLKRYNGLQLTTPSNSNGSLNFVPRNWDNDDYSCEFKIVSASQTQQSLSTVCSLNGVEINSTMLSSKPTLRVEKQNGISRVYSNGVLLGSLSVNIPYPVFSLGNAWNITIDDLKFMRL